MGVTRFLDEATRRAGALDSPMTILRSGTPPSGGDVPYGPIVRAIEPALARLDDAELATGRRPGDRRHQPPHARDRRRVST